MAANDKVTGTTTGREVITTPDIYRGFVKTALVVALTVGATLGALSLAAMGLAGTTWSTWRALTEAHGVAQLLGWVGLFIMGIAYHVLPRLKATELRARPLRSRMRSGQECRTFDAAPATSSDKPRCPITRKVATIHSKESPEAISAWARLRRQRRHLPL